MEIVIKMKTLIFHSKISTIYNCRNNELTSYDFWVSDMRLYLEDDMCMG